MPSPRPVTARLTIELHQALRQWHGRTVADELRERGIIIKSPSMRGIAEEGPGADKDSIAVVAAAHLAGLWRRVVIRLARHLHQRLMRGRA